MNKVGKRFWLSIINLFLFLATVVVNALAVLLPINNKSTGLTFSIWGVIYLLLAVYCIYELLSRVRCDSEYGAFIDRVGPLFIFTSIINIGWIFAWHYELVPLSVVIMLLFLLILIAIYLKLRIGMSEASPQEKYLVHMPFSIYFGWICLLEVEWFRPEPSTLDGCSHGSGNSSGDRDVDKAKRCFLCVGDRLGTAWDTT
jgi:hypothetical protein